MQSTSKRKPLSQETKDKISASKRALYRSGKIQTHNKGVPWSEEVKQKISLAKRGKTTWNKGIATPEAIRSKISASRKGQVSHNKGKKWTPEEIEKRKAGMRMYWQRRKAQAAKV